MNWNPFSKRINGIGPGPADMAQARIRALATIARQAERESMIDKRELERKAVCKPQAVILD